MNWRAYTRDMEGVLSLVLLAGVAVSFVLLVAGLALSYAGVGPPLESPVLSHNALQFLLQTLGLAAAGAGGGRTLVLLGLLTLLLTPYVRVLSSAILFARRRDRTYTLITLFVLLVLTATLALA